MMMMMMILNMDFFCAIIVHLLADLGVPQLIVMILNFWTDRSRQLVQTQIRLLLEEQSDQGLHYLLFNLHILDEIP